MLETISTKQFKRDVKRMDRRGKSLAKLKKIIGQLANKELLDLKHRDHSLTGDYLRHRECHIEPDWVLIYKIISDTLLLERTGSHSDLFNK